MSIYIGAAWTISFLLEKIISNLTAMNSELTVVQDTVNLLVALVDSKERGRQVLKSPIFANLSSCVQSNAMDTLPAEANRGKISITGASLERVQWVKLHPSVFRKPLLHPSIFQKLSEKKENWMVFDRIRVIR